MTARALPALACAALLALVALLRRGPEVPFDATPEPVVAAMLDLAHVGPGDVVYDLGCGDGRIVVAAAARGARRAVGVDLDGRLLEEARASARRAGVEGRAAFVQADLFDVDLRDATVVTLYLLEGVNARLRPRLAALAPGTRIVSHAFGVGDWRPDEVREVDGRRVYAFTVPPRGTAR